MNKLLILVDVQNDFIFGVLGTKEAQEAVPKIVEKLNNWDGDIICTKDTHHASDYLDTLEGKNLPVPHCIEHTEGWMIDMEVYSAAVAAATKNSSTVHKLTKDTFGSTDLPDFIQLPGDGQLHDYDYIEFVGFCTDICVVSNVLIVKAAFPEVEIAVDASCCAGTTPENHQHALEVMKSCQVEILNG